MNLIRDIRYALRALRGRPTVSAVVMVTLGLGIGTNAIFFAGFYGMVMKPLPFEEPERLVVLNESRPHLGESRRRVSAANLRDWMEDNSVFVGAGAYRSRRYNFMASSAEPERIVGVAISAELLPLLGVNPALGRHFRPEEDVPGGPLVVLISHASRPRAS